MFSYLDTQLTRLGGPNFNQIPINRPIAPVNDNFRDGMHQQAVHSGRTPYLPNGVGGGCPFLADPVEDGGYMHIPRPVAGPKIRERFQGDDHTQAAMFFHSLSAIEQDHVILAFTFELGQGRHPGGRRSDDLPSRAGRPADRRRVSAEGLGARCRTPRSMASRVRRRRRRCGWSTTQAYPVDGRVVQILATDGCDLGSVRALKDELDRSRSRRPRRRPAQGCDPRSRPQVVRRADRRSLVPHRVRGGGGCDHRRQRNDTARRRPVRRHLRAGGVPPPQDRSAPSATACSVLEVGGIPTGEAGVAGRAEGRRSTFGKTFVGLLGLHRHWERGPLALAERPPARVSTEGPV